MNFTTIERCNKTTDDLIAKEETTFLQQPIEFLKANQEHYIYLESADFEAHKMDAVVIEFDEMFEVYTALFGLRIQKKHGPAMKDYFKEHITSMLGSSSASFSGDEGIWEINIAFDALEGFTGKETIEEATAILVSFIDTMLAEIL